MLMYQNLALKNESPPLRLLSVKVFFADYLNLWLEPSFPDFWSIHTGTHIYPKMHQCCLSHYDDSIVHLMKPRPLLNWTTFPKCQSPRIRFFTRPVKISSLSPLFTKWSFVCSVSVGLLLTTALEFATYFPAIVKTRRSASKFHNSKGRLTMNHPSMSEGCYLSPTNSTAPTSQFDPTQIFCSSTFWEL